MAEAVEVAEVVVVVAVVVMFGCVAQLAVFDPLGFSPLGS